MDDPYTGTEFTGDESKLIPITELYNKAEIERILNAVSMLYAYRQYVANGVSHDDLPGN